MRRVENTRYVLLIKGISLLIIAGCLTTNCRQLKKANGTEADSQSFVQTGIINSMGNGTKWSRCFMTNESLIYFKDSLMSSDGGKTLVKQERLNLEEINKMRTYC